MNLEITNKGLYGYEDVESEYFEKRQLRKKANWLLLWGLGVGAAISGNFFGWNFGLLTGDFIGLAIATFLMAIMYVCLVFTIAELSAALPYASGLYSFTRHAFGPIGGLLCGFMTLIQYLIMPAVIVISIGEYLNDLIPFVPLYLRWLLLYAIFVGINIRSVQLTLKVSLFLTRLVILILLIFYVSAFNTGSFHIEALFSLQALSDQAGAWLPNGWFSVFAALPFGLSFYLAIEQLPVAAEETHDVSQNMPKALIHTILTLLALSLLTLFISNGVGNGSLITARSDSAISYGFRTIFGVKILSTFIVLLALIASFHPLIYTYGRILFALSRAGYLPRSLSVTTDNQTPARALILGSIIGLIYAFVIEASGSRGYVGAVLLNMAVFAALFSYIMVFASYIILKRERRDLARPYKSPLGIAGAVVGLIGAIIALLACFSDPNYRPGVYGVLIMLILLSLYFVFYSRKRLVAQAPEKEPALTVDISTKTLVIKPLLIKRAVILLCALIVIYGVVSYLLAPPGLSCAPNCMGMNLTGRYLKGANLAQINLIEANLRNANLSGANLHNADLSGAILVDANLENANLSGAKLFGVNLSRANLGGAILNDTNMNGANLIEANLTRVNLSETKLRGVILSEAKLVGADLSRVNLSGVRFNSANLNAANLREANLSGVSFSKADLSGAQLNESDLSGAWLNLTNLIGANLTGANLNGASLIGAKLASANLLESELVGTILVGADFNGANLNGANLSGAQSRKSQLRQNALLIDPALLQLNKVQLTEALQDTKLSGIYSNSQTKLPAQPVSNRNTLLEKEESTSQEAVGKIKVGILHSLSGPLATNEAPVYEATLLAINEINATGGILGQELLPVIQDGASDWQFFGEKALDLLVKDKVVVVFGGWTSASRQAVRPIFEKLNGLLFYPVQYEGQEQSPNIFYTGAEPTQQIIPAVEYLLRQGNQKIFLLGSDYVFPRRANTIIKAQLKDAGATVAGEEYLPLGESDFSAIISQIQSTQPDAIFNTLNGNSNVAFFKQFKEAGLTPQEMPVMSVSVAEEEIRQIGAENMAGHLTAWNYYQTIESEDNQIFVKAYKTAYGTDRVTSDSIHAGYFGVYLWKAIVEEAGSTDVDALKKALTEAEEDIQIMAPGGLVRLDHKTQHTYKIARIGLIREDGLIEEIFSSKEPIKPDPWLFGYEWATGLFSQDKGQ